MNPPGGMDDVKVNLRGYLSLKQGMEEAKVLIWGDKVFSQKIILRGFSKCAFVLVLGRIMFKTDWRQLFRSILTVRFMIFFLFRHYFS